MRVYSGEDSSLIASAEMNRGRKKQVEEICGIPSEIASLMDSFSCQLRQEMKPGQINS